MASAPSHIAQQLLETLTYQNPVQQVQVTDPTIASLINKACVEGDWKTLQETLERNNLSVNCELEAGTGITPLYIAVLSNQINLVKILVKQKGIELDCRVAGKRLVRYVLDVVNHFQNANYEMARVLMAAGADIEHDENGADRPQSVLAKAWIANNQTAAQLAIEYNASVSNAEASTKSFQSMWEEFAKDGEPESAEALKNLRQQIVLAKQWPQDIGTTLSQLSSKLFKALNLHIASFVFADNSPQMRALNRVYALLSEHRATVADAKELNEAIHLSMAPLSLHYQYAPNAPKLIEEDGVEVDPQELEAAIALSLTLRPIRDGKPVPPPPPPRKGL